MPAQCRYCPRVLADRRIRDAHETAIHGTRRFPCMRCGRLFPYRSSASRCRRRDDIRAHVLQAHSHALPPVDMATASGIAAPMGGLQNDLGGIDALATQSYHIGAPHQFIHYPFDTPGPEDMDAAEDFTYPNNVGWSNY